MVILFFHLISVLIKDTLLLSIYLFNYLFIPVLTRGSFYCLLSLSFFPFSLCSLYLSAHPFLSLSFFLQSFFCWRSHLSHEVFLHWLWLSVSSRCQLTLSSVPWVSCELVVAPEAWLDAGWIFVARPRHGWRYVLLSGGTRDLAVSLYVTLRLICGFRNCQPDSSIVKFPISSSSARFCAHW